MRVTVVHNAASDQSLPDEQDVLVQVETVCAALATLGHEARPMPCNLDLSDLRLRLNAHEPDLVFNLVESLDGKGRLIHVVPSALDAWAIPYTGAPADAMLLTSNKILAKERMEAAGLLTPHWIGPYPKDCHWRMANHADLSSNRWIIKSVWEHASLGLEDDGLVGGKDSAALTKILKNRSAGLGGACFGERFIDGREFNLSILAGPNGPEVLAPAEIVFEGYGPDKPRIIGYRAKWDTSSYEYRHTRRSFDFPAEDALLLAALEKSALRCWRIFGLKGYARVDFRVDDAGRIWILEVNANPCISPDAGFAAALERSSIRFPDALARILEDAQALRQVSPAPEGEIISVGSPIADPVSSHAAMDELAFRHEVFPRDVDAVRRLAASTGFFYPSEVDVAAELVTERLAKGDESGYYFTLCEKDGHLIGFTIYGPIPCTATSFDIYWIAVRPDYQGKGLGKILMQKTEDLIRDAGGRRIYIETSDRPQYAGTRKFYQRCGYLRAALLEDFYGPDDAKAIYVKIFAIEILTGSSPAPAG